MVIDMIHEIIDSIQNSYKTSILAHGEFINHVNPWMLDIRKLQSFILMIGLVYIPAIYRPSCFLKKLDSYSSYSETKSFPQSNSRTFLARILQKVVHIWHYLQESCKYLTFQTNLSDSCRFRRFLQDSWTDLARQCLENERSSARKFATSRNLYFPLPNYFFFKQRSIILNKLLRKTRWKTQIMMTWNHFSRELRAHSR